MDGKSDESDVELQSDRPYPGIRVRRENGGSRMVNFDVSIVVKNRLDNLSFAFDVSAPEDATVQNELTAMGGGRNAVNRLCISW